MIPRRAVLVLFVLSMVLAATGCGMWRRPDFTVRETPLETFTLDNGMPVYALVNREQPLVTLDMWVRTGSKDEPESVAGISHFLEHMLFKGTERLAVGEYDRRIEGLGGYLNAATSTDYTHYYIVVPSEHMEAALIDMADVMLHSTIDAGEVERERQVILEEIRLKEDNPMGFLYDEIVRRSYVDGPYRHTVIGNRGSVSAMTRDQLAGHHDRFYVPGNMALVVAGDVDVDVLRRRLRSLFSSHTAPLDPWRDEAPPSIFAGPQQATWQRDWQQTYFMMTWPGPAMDSIERMVAVEMAYQLMAGGRMARLVNSLREKQNLVTSIGAWFPSNKYPSFFAIHGACAADQLNAVRDAVNAELEKARDRGFTREEMDRARRQLMTGHAYQVETNTGKAEVVGYSHALFGDARLLDGYVPALNAVTEKEVLAVLEDLRRGGESFYAAQPASSPAAVAAP